MSNYRKIQKILLLLVMLTAGIRASAADLLLDYRILATSRTSTMEKE